VAVEEDHSAAEIFFYSWESCFNKKITIGEIKNVLKNIVSWQKDFSDKN
jgi:hypothetical protein